MAVDPHLVRVSDNIDPTDSEGETELGLLGSGSKSMYKVEGGDGDGESRDGSTYKVETQSGNFLIYKYVMPSSQYSEFGLANIHELDLATRLQHPAIMHAIKVVISSDRVGYLLPLAERSLVDLIQDQFVTTDVKLPILYKIATGLAFLHQNNILHLNVNPEHIVLQVLCERKYQPQGFGEGKYQPLLLLDDRGRPNSINYQAPEGGMSEKVDVWAFGMVMLQLINPKPFVDPEFSRNIVQLFSDPGPILEHLLRGVRPIYQSRCKDLLLQILNLNPHARPTMQQVCEDPLFADIRQSEQMLGLKLGLVNAPSINPDYSSDHRNVVKVIIHWAGLLYPTENTELLFLAVDLYHRTAHHFKEQPSDRRMALAATCLWLAAKLCQVPSIEFPGKLCQVSGIEFTAKLCHVPHIALSKYIPVLNTVGANITPEQIIQLELEVIGLLDGILNISAIYRCCQTVDEIKLSFANLIMARDFTTYARTDPQTWKETMATMISTPASSSIPIKTCTIAELVGLPAP